MINKIVTTLNILLLFILIFTTYNLHFKPDSINWNVMFEYPLNCTDEAIEEINYTGAIGEQRRSRHCVIRHGSYTEWLDGKLVMKGQYSKGKKIGRWIWYDDKGNQVNEKTY